MFRFLVQCVYDMEVRIIPAPLDESKTRVMIHNMREAGYAPSREGYEFILEQFAAVGHHVGALQVMQEMTHCQASKTHKTYGLCLMVATRTSQSLQKWT